MPPLLIGLALGGAAMYFLDPDRGRRRRARVRDRAVGATHCARDFVNDGVRDLKNRGSAVTGRVKSIFSKREANDRTLVERVRSVMGHHVGHPGAIDVYAADGKVTLNGSILSHERADLIDAVGTVAGVDGVVDHLAVYERAEGISELQGGREPRRRSYSDPREWPAGAQLVAGAALGVYLLLHSRKARGLFYLAATAAALARLTPREQLEHLTGSHAPEAGSGRVEDPERVHETV